MNFPSFIKLPPKLYQCHSIVINSFMSSTSPSNVSHKVVLLPQPLLVLWHFTGTFSYTLPSLRCSSLSLLLATNHLSLLPYSLKILGIRCKVFFSINCSYQISKVALAWISLPSTMPQCSLIFATWKIFIHRIFQQLLSHGIILNLIAKNISVPRILNLNVPISVCKISSSKICSWLPSSVSELPHDFSSIQSIPYNAVLSKSSLLIGRGYD